MRKFYLIGLMAFFMVSWMKLYAAHNITEDSIDTLGPESIPELIDAARSTDPGYDDVRIKAIRKLGELKAKEAQDFIIEILETKRTIAGRKEVFNWRLKVVAAKALADIGDAKACSYLAGMLRKDSDQTVKRAAAQALGILGETARKRNILDVMHSEIETSRDNALVSDLCEALGKIGDKSSFVYLLRVTQGPYLNYVKETAQKSIAMTKWDKPSVMDEEGTESTNASVSQYKK